MTTTQAFTPVIAALTGMAGRIRNAHNQRKTEQMAARFPAHLLKDMGYERDWDGSIHQSERQA